MLLRGRDDIELDLIVLEAADMYRDDVTQRILKRTGDAAAANLLAEIFRD